MEPSTRQRSVRHRYIFILPCYALFIVFLASIKHWKTYSKPFNIGRHVLQSTEADDDGLIPECLPPGIDSFPGDFFTQEQRQAGGVVVHFILLLYLCAMLANVCDDYFVPSLDNIVDRLKIPSDVAGATFMAIGTSSPELFSSIIGAFITENDIGVGTIVGSAVFNILGVTALAGIVLGRKEVEVEWYPVTRDCSVYLVTVAVLTIVISNNIVLWWEALIMLVMFGMYIILMYFNTGVEKISHRYAKKVKSYWNERNCGCCKAADDGDRTPLLSSTEQNNGSPEVYTCESRPRLSNRDSYSIDFSQARKEIEQGSGDTKENEKLLTIEEVKQNGSLCSPPDGVWKRIWWAMMWPSALLFFVSIPDCRKASLKIFFLLTFISSTAWLGVLSYLSVWMVTIIGYTFGIPDTVSGLTLLAVGTSLPEIISSIIVVKNGLGNMVMSNLIGSNIFDILFCLGAPWFIRALTSHEGFVVINSSAMTYTTTTLLVTIVALLLVFHISGWKLNRTMGIICLIVYVVFVILSCLYEMNVFGPFNPPPC